MFNDAATTFIFTSLVKNRRLLLEMARRDISDRYAGQILGTIWAVVHPLTAVAVYIFMFAVVFRVKTDDTLAVPGDHTLYMLSGLIPWLVIADVFGRSSSIISNQASLVKQVVFPIEILPVKMVLASLPTFGIGLVALVVYALVSGRASPALLLYPLAAIPLYLFLCGFAFLFAAIGVFLKDVRELIQMYTLIGLYIAPIFYFMDWVPAKVQLLLYANPVTTFIETFHDAAYYGGVRNWMLWCVAVLLGLVSTWFGAFVFSRLKPHFGSYL